MRVSTPQCARAQQILPSAFIRATYALRSDVRASFERRSLGTILSVHPVLRTDALEGARRCTASAGVAVLAASSCDVAFDVLRMRAHVTYERAHGSLGSQYPLPNSMRQELSLFVASCFLHGLPWDAVRVCAREAVCLTPREAVRLWFTDREPVVVLDRSCSIPPCNPTCSNRRNPGHCGGKD